jgi:hypothetical protein
MRETGMINGDFTACSNVLLVSGAGDRRYVERPAGTATGNRGT